MFSPYHRLNNCIRLERWIRENHENGSISDDVLTGYNRYHFALVHKLKSAKIHYENLENLLENTDIANTISNSDEFLQEVNLYLDSFFYCCGSSLDILAREVLVYFNIAFPTNNKVYYRTARQLINAARSGDSILPRLQDPNWKDEFSNYRNALTHEVLIAGIYNIQVIQNGMNQQMVIKFPLPDDPRVDIPDRLFNNNPDALDYCKTTFTRLLSLINQIYGEIENRATTTGNLPL